MDLMGKSLVLPLTKQFSLLAAVDVCLCSTWGAVQMNHEVVVGGSVFCRVGTPTAVELSSFRAVLVFSRQHAVFSFSSYFSTFSYRGGSMQLHGAEVFDAAVLHVLQFRQTPAL